MIGWMDGWAERKGQYVIYSSPLDDPKEISMCLRSVTWTQEMAVGVDLVTLG